MRECSRWVLMRVPTEGQIIRVSLPNRLQNPRADALARAHLKEHAIKQTRPPGVSSCSCTAPAVPEPAPAPAEILSSREAGAPGATKLTP